jgi:RNA polymerase-interacting CarD/CdnL/TRCF family regulator
MSHDLGAREKQAHGQEKKYYGLGFEQHDMKSLVIAAATTDS